MKKIEIGLVGLLFSMNVMAECPSDINKEFLSIYNHPPYDIAKIEAIYNSCKVSPFEMLLYVAKGEKYLRNGEVENASLEYAYAHSKYIEIDDDEIAKYKGVLEDLEEKIEKYTPKTAGKIRGMIDKTTNNSRGAGLTTEYTIEKLPLNFQSSFFEIKKGVNMIQAEEIYKVLSSKEYKGKKIRIIGYTDTSGKPDNNKVLSEQRAKALANYLKNRGLTNKIVHSGKGESKPICTEGKIVPQKNYQFKCSIKEDKYRSRRVNITIGDI